MNQNNTHQEEIKEENETLVNEEILTEETNEECINDENVIDINSELEVKKIKDELDEANEQYKRLQAEYANYRRRTQQEKETMGLFANEKIIGELVPVVDSMERALDAFQDKEDTVYQGIDLVYKQLKDTLDKFGLEEIEAENAEFDPNLHLAVMQESIDGVDPNTVVMVLQKGYKLGTKIIRPSMVKVSC